MCATACASPLIAADYSFLDFFVRFTNNYGFFVDLAVKL